MTLLNEPALRRPSFVEGVRVKLSDGQEWTLPKPRVGIIPEVNAEGKIVFGERIQRSFGPAYDAMLDAYVNADDGVTEFSSLLDLAVDLLGRNYELAPEQYLGLLHRWLDDEANSAMWRAIQEVAFGRTPKPTPVG